MQRKNAFGLVVMTGKSYVKFFFRLQDNNNNKFAYIVLQLRWFKDCRLFPIRKTKQMEFGTETMKAKRKKMVHDSMKQIACRSLIFVSNSTMGYRIWFISHLCHTNAFHLAYKQVIWNNISQGTKINSAENWFFCQQTQWSELVWHKKLISTFESSAFHSYLNEEKKRFEKTVTMTFSISIFLIVMCTSVIAIQHSIVWRGVHFFSI